MPGHQQKGKHMKLAHKLHKQIVTKAKFTTKKKKNEKLKRQNEPSKHKPERKLRLAPQQNSSSPNQFQQSFRLLIGG